MCDDVVACLMQKGEASNQDGTEKVSSLCFIASMALHPMKEPFVKLQGELRCTAVGKSAEKFPAENNMQNNYWPTHVLRLLALDVFFYEQKDEANGLR